MATKKQLLFGIGWVSARSGVAPSALRFYEEQGLISSVRADSGRRRYSADVLRRIAFVRAAQELGLSLHEVHAALAKLPEHRTPNERDWAALARAWRPRLDERIARLERLRDRLDSCVGCGCLSLTSCKLLNPGDVAARRGPGARYLIEKL
jgi:MerR family redox-sensitive transcriptional activator SoxR